jgi:hypothetical protein
MKVCVRTSVRTPLFTFPMHAISTILIHKTDLHQLRLVLTIVDIIEIHDM